MIAEAAYYLAQKRGISGERALDDWFTAEQQVRQVISPQSCVSPDIGVARIEGLDSNASNHATSLS